MPWDAGPVAHAAPRMYGGREHRAAVRGSDNPVG
jgi:hypothetical protein